MNGLTQVSPEPVRLNYILIVHYLASNLYARTQLEGAFLVPARTGKQRMNTIRILAKEQAVCLYSAQSLCTSEGVLSLSTFQAPKNKRI